MDWMICLLAMGAYFGLLGLSNHMAARKAAREFSPMIEQVYTEQYWHDDWNKRFVELGGEAVLTEAEQAARPKVSSTTTQKSDDEVIDWWLHHLNKARNRNRSGPVPQNPTPRPMRCDCCGLPHREWDCDCDICEDREDEDDF